MVDGGEELLVGREDKLVFGRLSNLSHNLPFNRNQVVLMAGGGIATPEGELVPGGSDRFHWLVYEAILDRGVFQG